MKRIFTTALFVTLSAFSISVIGQSESREELLKRIESKRAELSILENSFLAPSEDDRATYAEFLKQEDTGLIRLLPREVYDQETKMTIRGGGAFYSFVRLTHAYGYGSDIMLDQGHLAVGFAGADYGILVKMGDIPLEQVALNHPSSQFMFSYRPPTEEPRARAEYRQFGAGQTIDGTLYKSRLPAEVNTTYLLRSIDYGTSDVLVAFRVFRKDSDGSLIIAWKLLNKFPKPDLARPAQATN